LTSRHIREKKAVAVFGDPRIPRRLSGILRDGRHMTQKAQIALKKLQDETERNMVLVEQRLENSPCPSGAAAVSAAKYYPALSSLAKE
jgi:hypothetical protein